ncbi:MAG: hypothetical protein AB1567_12800 [bacterium]
MKFQRRKDLTPSIRLWIAISAFMQQGLWGAMTKLARQYKISRQLVYILLWSLLETFQPDKNLPALDDDNPQPIKTPWNKLVLALKLQGCCSVGDISEILKSLGIRNSAVGKISEFLNKIANSIPDEISEGQHCIIVVLADEIFMAGKPILIGLDAKSHCILKAIVAEDRSGQQWASLFELIGKKGYRIDLVVADCSKGLIKGCQLTDLIHHPDLMHLIWGFAPFLARLERRALAAIEAEAERERVISNARSERVLLKREEQYIQASIEAEEAIRQYDDFAYLWQCLLNGFNLFNEDGTLRTRQEVEGEVMAIIELIENDLGVEALVEVARKFKEAVVNYWGYFDRAEEIHRELSDIFPEDVLQEICLWWQAEKKSRGAKDYKRKKMLEKEAQEHLFLAKCADIEQIDKKIAMAFERLEDNVRSSSPIEAINSQIRDFINSNRGQITQEMLDLMVYFLNHKRANRGPHKGTTPWERFTGKKEDGLYLDQLLKLAGNAQ